MNVLVDNWKTAVNMLSRAELDLEVAIKEQFSVEKTAFFEVFGKDTTQPGASMYDDQRINYYEIDDTGRLDAVIYGSYGGENHVKWNRGLINLTGDELYHHYVKLFTDLKQCKENEIRKSKDAKRAHLLAELAELDKV